MHNKELLDPWRNYFHQLDDSIQALTLQQPRPLTPRFVERMLPDGPSDPEIGRQITYGYRSFAALGPQNVLDCCQLQAQFAILDPESRVMSDKVVYTHMKTAHKQKIKFVDPHFFGGAVNDISILNRHN